jgi:hypothetical protein
MDKKPSENAEALGRKLQEKLQHERPRWLRWVPLLAVILFGITGIVAWLAYPEPVLPPLTVTVLDVLAAAGEPAQLRAQLDPAEPDAKTGSLAGLEVTFGTDRAGVTQQTVSDARGEATTTLDLAGAVKATVQARQTSSNRKQKIPEDRGRVYIHAKDAPLLLIDVEETMADLDVKLWPKTNPDDIAVRAGAGAALHAARNKEKFAIVYLAVANMPAREYRRVRGWIAQPKLNLPDGPVLGRLRYDASTIGEARQALLSDLRGRFTGPLVAVVRTSEAAEQCLALRIRAIAMGGGDYPEQVTRIKSWDELPAALPR